MTWANHRKSHCFLPSTYNFITLLVTNYNFAHWYETRNLSTPSLSVPVLLSPLPLHTFIDIEQSKWYLEYEFEIVFQYATCLMVILATEIAAAIYAAMHSHMVSAVFVHIIARISLRSNIRIRLPWNFDDHSLNAQWPSDMLCNPATLERLE